MFRYVEMLYIRILSKSAACITTADANNYGSLPSDWATNLASGATHSSKPVLKWGGADSVPGLGHLGLST